MRLTAVLLPLLLMLALPVYPAQRVEVEISGVTGEVLDNVRASLRIEQQKQRAGLTPPLIERLHARAKRDIERALEPFGYYRPTISAELQAPVDAQGPWRASYRIDQGEAIPITRVDIDFAGGQADPKLAGLAASSRLHSESTLDHRRYEQAKRSLVQGLRELGYLDAELTEHRVEVDLEAYQASIYLQIHTGPQYVFGEIDFVQDLFDPHYLRRYLTLRPGEPYSSESLARQRRALSKSGHFQEVQIEPQPATSGEPPAIPLEVRLEPFKPNRYRGRLGWGTDTGIGVDLDWTRRYFGRQGHHFTLGAAAVQERRKLAGDFGYFIPLDPLEGSLLELDARHESKDLTYQDVALDEGGETRIATNILSAFWRHPRRSWAELERERTLGLGFLTETYDVFDVLFGNLSQDSQDAISEAIGPEARATLSPDFRALIPSVRWTLRRSDDPLFIRRGDYLSLELRGASESLGSNLTFWQTRLRTWHIRPIREHGRLLLRSDIGYSNAESREVLGANFNLMPEYYEFRAGGARSVRGYGYETLYPSNAVTGAKNQLVGSIEYDHEVIADWSAAVFLDAGNAFNRFDDMDIKLGTGVGVRWRSPVGLARLDLGIPLDDADDPFQIYILVGPEF